VPGESLATARHLSDLFSLLAPKLDREIMLFDTAVQTSELNAEGGDVAAGTAKLKADSRFANLDPRSGGEVPKPTATGPAMGGAGAGPGGGFAPPRGRPRRRREAHGASK